MSAHSSEDEEAMDGLTIKPPQHVHHHHKDRKRDRSHRHPNKSRKEIPVAGGGDDEDRRRHHRRHPTRNPEVRGSGHPRGERYSSQQQQHPPQEVEGHRSRSSNKKYFATGPGGIEGPPGGERHSSSSSRHHKSSSRSRRPDVDEEVVKIPRDKRSMELLTETKQKRKHIELENERALREIERRRDKERASGGGEGSSGSRQHRRAHRQDEEKRQQQQEQQQLTPSPEDNKSDSELREHINIEVMDLEDSSSELEEGEERSPLSPSQVPVPESEKSDVSSASENEDDRRDETKATSDVSSDTSSSRKSRSGDRSDVSSSSSSSGSDSDNEHDQENGEAVPKPAKLPRKDDSPPPSPLEIQNDDITEIPIESHSKKHNGNDIPVVVVTEEEEEEKDLLPPYFPALQGCRRVEEFQLLNRIEEGTYGVVYRAKDKRTDEIVALKRLKMEKEKDGFPITSLREINTLLKAQHENIVTVREIVVGSNTDKIFLVMDYVEHDLKSLMETLKQKNQVFLPEEVKCLMIQLLRAVAHLHDNWILHRDLKTSNLLLSHKGILKVGDFGLAREYGSPLKNYTPIVVTLWYRAPELLLGTREYSCPIDVWSVGCIFGELLKMEPMFPGKSEANQLNLIFQSLGTPNDRIWPGYTQMPLLQKMTFADYPVNKLKTRFGHLSELGIDLMNKFLTFNPAKRFTAEESLDHAFFKEIPIPIDPSMFPTWPAKSEMGHRKAQASPKPPSGGQQFKGCKEDEDPAGLGFFLGGGDARRQQMGAGFSLKF